MIQRITIKVRHSQELNMEISRRDLYNRDWSPQADRGLNGAARSLQPAVVVRDNSLVTRDGPQALPAAKEEMSSRAKCPANMPLA
jgi:hypothetical protein